MATTLELPVLKAAQTGRRWWWTAPLLVAVAIYLVLSLWLAHTKAPWCDEGWFANPAYNLAFRGNMGTSVLEPGGFHLNAYFRGVQERTYLFPPNHLVALAGWFRLFGPSILAMRLYSICWSAVSLLVLFYLFSRFFPDRRVAVIGTLFTAIDFIFLWSTADGRTEASANALALCALASYVFFRERGFPKAVIYSQILGASAVFIHPNAAVVVLAVWVVAWRFDRERLRWQYLFLAATPYLFFAFLWWLYIRQSPGEFLAQFTAHAAGHHAERFRRIIRPDIAIGTEIVRHLAAYYLGGLWGGVMAWWMAIIPCLYLPAVIWFLRGSRQYEVRTRMFLTYGVALLFGMTFLNGFKGDFYLIYVVPVYDAVLAAWLLSLWARSRLARYGAVGVAATFVCVQLLISIVHIRADEYHRDWEPTVREMARDSAQGKSIVGTAALGFGMDFRGFKDDVRLGMYSGLDPDVVVMDRSYRHFAGFFQYDEPPVFTHILTALSKTYRLTAQHGSFWIFERARPGPDGKLVPWIDARTLADAIDKRRDSIAARP